LPSIWLKAFDGKPGHKKSCWLEVQGQQEWKWNENNPRLKSGIEYQTFLE